MKNSKNRFALLAGISLIIMAAIAGFSYGYVHGNLIVDGDASVLEKQ